jgi:hypothetical protein
MTSEPKPFLVRFFTALLALDRRWIFLAVGALSVIFMTVNVRLPIPVSKQSEDMFKTITSLPEGARVHLSIDYGPSSQAELWPQHVVILRQLFRQRVKVIASSLWADGPSMIERGFREVLAELKKEGIEPKRGVDFVNLGYKAGDRVAIAKIASSFKETFPVDYQGNRSADLPIMQGWDDYSGIDLLITIAVGDPGATEYIQQAQSRYNVRMVAGVTAVLSPQLYSFYQSKNLLGFLGGLAGAAEYETLAGEPGLATRGMNVQSAVHMLIVLFVLAGNAAYFYLRWRGEKVR